MKELEGKVIDVFDYDGSFLAKGKVIGCDYDIGITIVDKDDPDEFLYCWIGKSSSLWKNHWDASDKTLSDEFDSYVNQIKGGCFEYSKITGETTPAASAKVCPFGQ